MKKVRLFEVREEVKNGDSFSEWFLDGMKAIEKFEGAKSHLTKKEAQNQETTMFEYFISLPEDYEPKTAEQIIIDLFNGEIECPEYDIVTGAFNI